MGASPSATVVELVERFERDRKVFLSPDYTEEQLRVRVPAIRRSTFVARTFLAPVIHAADGSQLTAYSLRLSDSDSGRSAASRWPSPASVLSPHSSILSSDILGQVYELFLGKVIRLTAGHQAKVEEEPEVRKAGELRPALDKCLPQFQSAFCVSTKAPSLDGGRIAHYVPALP